AAGGPGGGVLQRRAARRRPPHHRRARDRRPSPSRAGQASRGRPETMSLKRQIRELELKAQRDPQNLAVRLQLAAVLRAVGRREEGTALVRSVALAYHGEGRIAQALAVCRSLLEIAPGAPAPQALFAGLGGGRPGGPGEEPPQWADGRGRRPTLPPIASPLPVVEASPDDYEIEEETAPPASGVER